jgi:hypothetical protein
MRHFCNLNQTGLKMNTNHKPPSPTELMDALCYLAGVNYGSVIKVLAAVDAIDFFDPRIQLQDIVEARKASDCPLRPRAEEHHARAAEARRFVVNLVRQGYAEDPALRTSVAKFGRQPVI